MGNFSFCSPGPLEYKSSDWLSFPRASSSRRDDPNKLASVLGSQSSGKSATATGVQLFLNVNNSSPVIFTTFLKMRFYSKFLVILWSFPGESFWQSLCQNKLLTAGRWQRPFGKKKPCPHTLLIIRLFRNGVSSPFPTNSPSSKLIFPRDFWLFRADPRQAVPCEVVCSGWHLPPTPVPLDSSPPLETPLSRKLCPPQREIYPLVSGLCCCLPCLSASYSACFALQLHVITRYQKDPRNTASR